MFAGRWYGWSRPSGLDGAACVLAPRAVPWTGGIADRTQPVVHAGRNQPAVTGAAVVARRT
jgi:hypothetical protein